MKKISRKNFLLIPIFLIILIFNYSKKYEINKLTLLLEEQVRQEVYGPTQAARFYALASSIYYDSLVENQNSFCAYKQAEKYALGVKKISKVFQESKIEDFLANKVCLQNSFSKWDNFQKNDSWFTNPKYEKPITAKWYSDWPPVTPNAGKWSRFSIASGTDFKVSAPPRNYDLEIVKILEAQKNITDLNRKEIDYFAGGPRTESPGGIWLNIFYKNLENKNLSNEEIAYKQKILTQTVVDAFMECWKVKFTYWTARPNQLSKQVEAGQVMNSPNFPSYVSGHSTISYAAATVLAHMFPEESDDLFKLADKAKQSRLFAGIHFPIDNEEGMELGKKVGQYYVDNVLGK